jgi:hypothetical protein
MVSAIPVSRSDVYVGGNIARWRDGAWSCHGEADENGVDGPVSALAVEGGVLHVGGSFTSAGGQISTGYAQWRFRETPLFESGFETPVSANLQLKSIL